LSVRSRTCWLTGRWEDALASATEAVAALTGLPETPQLARALARLSQIQMLRQQSESIQTAERAVDVARRVHDPFAEVNARINLFTQSVNEGIAPSPEELASIVDSAVEAGEYEEAYRAVVNFVWSVGGFLAIDETERWVATLRERLADVPAPPSIGPYLDVSIVMLLLVPAGRWAEADAELERLRDAHPGVTLRLVYLSLEAGLALRRGRVDAAVRICAELEPLAIGSGEPQRIGPMAAVVGPLHAVRGEHEALRALIGGILDTPGWDWPASLDSIPIVRALAAVEATDLLERMTESLRSSKGLAAKSQTALLAGDGLLALAAGRAADAVDLLTEAAGRERRLGRAYDAALLDLDLARALEASGDTEGSVEARARAKAVLEPLGCVNPY
jgi:hypothetical protein